MKETAPQTQPSSHESVEESLRDYHELDDATKERMQAVGKSRIPTDYEPGKWRRSLTAEEVAEVASAMLYEQQLDIAEAVKNGSVTEAEGDKAQEELVGANYYIAYATVHDPRNSISFLRDAAFELTQKNDPDLDKDSAMMSNAARVLTAVRAEASKKDSYIEEHNVRVGRNAQRELEY